MTDNTRGYVKGMPRRFIKGHHAYFAAEPPITGTELDHAWAAGVFDGEGTVFLTPRRSTYSLVVSIGQTSRDDSPAPMLVKLRRHYRGALSEIHREGRRQHHVWSLSCRAAENFLRSIQPFVVQKKDQVDVALEYRERCLGDPEAAIVYRDRLRSLKR